MNEAGKHITQHLFGKQDLAHVSKRELEMLTEQYPYFAVPQFLLARKLHVENAGGKASQLRKTALFFNNPYWLSYLLDDETAEEIVYGTGPGFASTNGEMAAADDVEERKDFADTNELPPVEEKSNAITETIAEVAPETAERTSNIDIQEDAVDSYTDEIVPAVEITAKEMAVEPADEIIPAIEIPEEGVVNETDEVVPALEITKTEFTEEPADEIVPAVEIPAEGVVNETEKVVPAVEVIRQDFTNEHAVADSVVVAGTEHFEDESTGSNEEQDSASAEETDTQRIKLSSLIEQHLADFKKPVAEHETLPVKANPFHTVDYFASQGIKADEQDKMTYRVRKFTDWLKQIKVKNPQPQDLGTDVETEKLIETIAATSNEQKDIVTEAMAEVLVKQGKLDKAVQLYKKLGLLNPDKSAYFAAKIDSLNNK